MMSLFSGSPCGPAQAPLKMANPFVMGLLPTYNANDWGHISRCLTLLIQAF
uniref:Uncharacterized protein n=1 Tax=Yersinia pseudotuberculosis serotype O:3 (strain YPIII) TaxID=502800 RepID=A0A0H3B429_YERPY